MMKGQTEKLQICTPTKGNYNINLSVLNGEMSLNQINYSVGYHNFNVFLNNSTFFSIKSNQNTNYKIKITERQANIIKLTSIVENSPVRYSANIIAHGKILVVLPQPYSNAWILNYHGKTYKGFSLYKGGGTGFLISNPNGTIIITFTMQSSLDVGYLVSLVFSITSISLLIYLRVKRYEEWV